MNDKSKFIAAAGAGVAAIVVPLVVLFEGTIYRGYVDPVGIVTACTGSIYDLDGSRLNQSDIGKPYTKEQCDELLYRELGNHLKVLSCIKRDVNIYVQAATVSFAYNVGDKAVCESRYMRKLNEGDPNACAELSRWTLAKGRELPGLVKRRAAERALCERKE